LNPALKRWAKFKGRFATKYKMKKYRKLKRIVLNNSLLLMLCRVGIPMSSMTKELKQIEEKRTKSLQAARRVVIKLGTSVVTNKQGELNLEHLEPIVRDISILSRTGRQIVLVSSGAVGLGAGHLGLATERKNDVVMKQACAAVGQNLLMAAYERLFRTHQLKIAQVLLTEDDFINWSRYQNLRRTMERLLKLGVLPIINENDTVSTAELKGSSANGHRVFSDNDRLAALVMSKLGADLLVLLTDVEGLLSSGPRANNGIAPAVIPLVTEITPELSTLAGGPTRQGRGGMAAKLEAAKIAMQVGTAIIASGRQPNVLARIFDGERIGTLFDSSTRLRGKKRWIAFATNVSGQLVVNHGAREAVLRGKASLLASGVVHVLNEFAAHDVVQVVDEEGNEFARGIVNFDSREALRLIASADKKRQRARDCVLITRDNLVVNESIGSMKI
jgi:glutamate 5-kinase